MHAYVFATWKVLFNRVITLLEFNDDFKCLDSAVTVLLRIGSRQWGVSSELAFINHDCRVASLLWSTLLND